jgi:hypothetical protein
MRGLGVGDREIILVSRGFLAAERGAALPRWNNAAILRESGELEKRGSRRRDETRRDDEERRTRPLPPGFVVATRRHVPSTSAPRKPGPSRRTMPGAVARVLSWLPGCCPDGPTLSPLSDPESRIGPEKAAEDASQVLRPSVTESRAEVPEGGKSFVVSPLYDEAPAVSDRGSCEPRLPHRLVGEREWLPIRSAPPTKFSGRGTEIQLVLRPEPLAGRRVA